jgi:hypothetical protein
MPALPCVAAYATCADKFEDTYLNEMGRQGWEMLSLSRLEETVPGGQWCRSATVRYGFEVAWKRVKWAARCRANGGWRVTSSAST